MKCTIHSARELEEQKTKYGIRWSCPVAGCTVVLWDGSTSTPADFGTRQARIQTHAHFDALWRSGLFTRKQAYKALAKHLGLPRRKTHIGYFNRVQCIRAIDFCIAHTKLTDGDIL